MANFINHNLEKGIPDNLDNIDIIVALDVLEHIENIHDVYKEFFSITNKTIVVALEVNGAAPTHFPKQLKGGGVLGGGLRLLAIYF